MDKAVSEAAEIKAANHRTSRMAVVTLIITLTALFAVHSNWVTSHAYSSPSVVLASQVTRPFVVWSAGRLSYHIFDKITEC